jgi:hypothetical protein
MSKTIISFPDPITWNSNADFIWMEVRNMLIGFHLNTGAFAILPGILRGVITEPALFVLVRPWFYRNSQWDRFTTEWTTTTNDYIGLKGGEWDSENAFGWEHEFDVYDPPAGNDVLVKNYIQLHEDHRSYRFITKLKPYYDLDNVGIEFMMLPNPTYISRITQVQVHKNDGTVTYLDLAQVKDIKIDVPTSILKIGLVYSYQSIERILPIFDHTQWDWETQVLQTQQYNIGGSDRWIIRIGGADTTTPNPINANNEMVF